MQQAIPLIFDRQKIRKHQDKANFISINDLFDWSTSEFIERLLLVKRDFNIIAEVGCQRDYLYEALSAQCARGRHHAIERYIQLSFSQRGLITTTGRTKGPHVITIQADEEYIPLKQRSVDLILGHLTWHFINDLPGFLKQLNEILKPNGFMLSMLFGEKTLQELASVFFTTQMETWGGVTPFVAPMITPHQAGNLLVRACFTLPVVDRHTLQIHYTSLWQLLKDIQAFAGQSSLYANHRVLTRGFLRKAEENYKKMFATNEGKLIVTLDFLFLSGWSYHSSQQKALKPHHAAKRLIEVL